MVPSGGLDQTFRAETSPRPRPGDPGFRAWATARRDELAARFEAMPRPVRRVAGGKVRALVAEIDRWLEIDAHWQSGSALAELERDVDETRQEL